MKNIFEIREKYVRISKSVDRSTPYLDFLEELPKSKENPVLWLWWETLGILLKQKLESQLYSTACSLED